MLIMTKMTFEKCQFALQFIMVPLATKSLLKNYSSTHNATKSRSRTYVAIANFFQLWTNSGLKNAS